MNRIDRRIQEVTALVDEGMRKHWPRPGLAAKARARIEQLETMNREQLRALERAAPWLGKMIADGAHQNSVLPQDCERTLQMVEAAIEKARQL